ncbi:MAG TPA: NADH-quinone oxidoreductase subunit NuoK [Myxococcota bacterium]|nr:NADH-quinone oxidoreductase subunit NuoK [Myxococcota bacterium]
MTVPLQAWLLLAAALFGVGLVGLLTRKNAVAMLISVELMANAVNLNLVALGFFRGDHTGQVLALFGIALTVAEVIVGLAIVILLHRVARTIDVDQTTELSG